MLPVILISIIVFMLLVVGILIVAAISLRKSNSNSDSKGMYPQGYWVSMGISIGAGFGVALGLVFDNLALGIAIGVAVGSMFGGIWEQRNKDRIRPLSEQERRNQRWAVILGMVMLLIGVGIFTWFLFARGGS
jgi:Mn2+/Fe2+ NRAMP family transporter